MKRQGSPPSSRSEPPSLGSLICNLVDEVSAGARCSLERQAREASEIEDLLRLPLPEVADEMVDAAAVDAELDQLFGGLAGGRCAIRVGAPYQATPEAPPVRELLGLELDPSAVRGGRLSDVAVALIRDAVRVRLAAEQRALLQRLANQGMPRVLIEGGTLTVPVRFQELDAIEPLPDSYSGPAEGEEGGAGAGERSAAPRLESIRVSTVDPSSPPDGRIGQISLTFRVAF